MSGHTRRNFDITISHYHASIAIVIAHTHISNTIFIIIFMVVCKIVLTFLVSRFVVVMEQIKGA